MTEKGKLLLVDGHNLLFQMFYGMPARIYGNYGKAIHGTLGFVGALLKMLRRIEPSHVLVLFDCEQENPRGELLPEYKANRIDYSAVPEEDNPFSQLEDVYAALDYMQIQHLEAQGCETDDLIASYVLTYGEDAQIVISSFDSDFFQLVSEHVQVLRYRGEHTVICDTAYIVERYGVLPAQYADFKALTGDTADNIPGVRGVGPKTAAQLLQQFGDLEGVIAGIADITKPSIRRAVGENAPRLRLNQRLIRLDAHAEIPLPLVDLRYEFSGITTVEVLRGIGLRA